jgi:hypothetical protein
VHVILADADHPGIGVSSDRQVEPRPRTDQDVRPDRPQKPKQGDVGQEVEPRVSHVVGMDQPAGAAGGQSPGPADGGPTQVRQSAQPDSRVEPEDRPVLKAVDADDFDVVAAGELARQVERRPDGAADGVGVRDEEADDDQRPPPGAGVTPYRP